MFGLQNFRGSCWVNACLQAVYRFPEVQNRYNSGTYDHSNKIDECLFKIFKSNGKEGLKELFECIRTETMPAGNDIGDSHELFQYLCEKLSFLENICRFKIAHIIQCSSCSNKSIKEDSVTEYSISSTGKFEPLADCISSSVEPITIPDWRCDKCNKTGCTQQQLIGTFPKAMIFHMISPNESSVNYSSVLVLNGKKYSLLSVVCFTGGHWLTHGRSMPPGSSWYTFNDDVITDHGSKQFPVSSKMRLLIYYRLED